MRREIPASLLSCVLCPDSWRVQFSYHKAMLSKTNCPLLSLCWPQMNLWVSAHEKRSLSSHSGLLRLKSLWVETIEYGTSEVSVLHALKKVSLLFFSKTWKKKKNKSISVTCISGFTRQHTLFRDIRTIIDHHSRRAGCPVTIRSSRHLLWCLHLLLVLFSFILHLYFLGFVHLQQNNFSLMLGVWWVQCIHIFNMNIVKFFMS